jgi:glucose/arabinose dehydrogenase
MRGQLRPFLWFVAASAIALPAGAQLKATAVVTGLDRPLAFVQSPADPTMQVLVQQSGRVRVVKNGALGADFLDLTADTAASGERGLLGFAFAPDYATSGRVFASFTNRAGDSVVARFTRSAADPLRADPSTRFDLVWPGGARVISQPFSNHNGGNIAFGPDGFLYLGLGDGGSGDDPSNNAQNPLSLLGKMLRIDVAVPDSDPKGYRVPASNPFVGRADVLSEIWAIGLRNPWRWSFDDPGHGGTGALVIADVGQGAWEEINYEPAGAGGRNYGWRNREGAHVHVNTLAPFSQPLVDPIFEYGHNTGQSITGGVVYRGPALGTSFRGRYFFADFVSSRVWSIGLSINGSTREATAGTLTEHTADLGAAGASPSSFGVDAAGDLYLVSYAGTVYKLSLASGPPPPASFGTKRKATGEVVGTAGSRIRP